MPDNEERLPALSQPALPEPEPDIVEGEYRELPEEPEPEPEPVLPPPMPEIPRVSELPEEMPMDSEKKWRWIGDKSEGEGESDGISDLFRVEDQEITDDVESATALDYEEDVLDAGPDGTIDDVTDVDTEDIMGGDGEGDDDDIIGIDEEEDLSDLFDLDDIEDNPFGVSRANEPPATANRARRIRRTWKPYRPSPGYPDSGLQGVR